MCGVMWHFGKDNNRELYASDLNEDVIKMWKSLQNGWIPPQQVSEEYYNELKNNKQTSAERGFVGASCSFQAQFFLAWKGKYNKSRQNSCPEKDGYKSIMKILPYMKNVNFYDSKSYDLYSPKNHLIYADPPYLGNKIRTEFFKNFDHDKFWNKMREWSKDNIVVVSELTAPDDFVKIWEKEYSVTCMKKNNNNQNKGYNFTESLFVHKNLLQ
jgi:DNA adenine methylase